MTYLPTHYQVTHQLIHKLSNSLNYQLIHQVTDSLTNSFIKWLDSPVHSPSVSLTHSPSDLLTHSPNDLLTIHWVIDLPIRYQVTHQLIHQLTHSTTQQDYYGRRCSALLHSYCTGTFTEVTVLLLWSSSNATFEYLCRYYNRVAVWVLHGNSIELPHKSSTVTPV